MKTLIDRLEAIAAKNDDSFRYQLNIEPQRRGFHYHFKAFETADGHEFVSGSGLSVEDAISKAGSEILNACEEWGYLE